MPAVGRRRVFRSRGQREGPAISWRPSRVSCSNWQAVASAPAIDGVGGVFQVKEVENDLGTFAFLVHDDSETVADGRRFVYPLMPNLPVTRVEPLSYILPLDGTTVGEVSVGLVICQVRRLTLSVLVAYFVHGRLRRERTQ